MTVTYGDECATVKYFGNFWKLLFRWRASIYKLLWVDLLIFLLIYYSLGLSYQYLLSERQRVYYERVCAYCSNQSSRIPLSFILGFYVTIVIGRWEAQFSLLPTPDTVAILVSASIPDNDDKSRLIRRTIVRYLNLSLIIMMMDMSVPAKKRFPTLDHLVKAGILLENEKLSLEHLEEKVELCGIYWVPLIWACNIIMKARKEGKITHDTHVESMLEEIDKYYTLCEGLGTYDSIPIPLVYTQVVTIAVYTFFLSALFGRQVLENDVPPHPIDLYFPLFTILEFLFYMGWLKVAEILLNPFGEDDDDFEVNWIIDRNIHVAYGIVDEIHQKLPGPLKDNFWGTAIPDILPYTDDSRKLPDDTPYIDVLNTAESTSSTSRHFRNERTRQHFQEKVVTFVPGNNVRFAFAYYPRVEAFFRRISSSISKTKQSWFGPRRQHQTRYSDIMDCNTFNTLLTRVSQRVMSLSELSKESAESECLLDDVEEATIDVDFPDPNDKSNYEG